MAMTVKYNPQEKYLSAHEDIVFVLLEDTKPFDSTTYPDYKYICDVYIKDHNGNEQFVARIKSYPRPGDKLGIFNIGNVVRSYIETEFSPNNIGVLYQRLGNKTFYAQVVCRFGEEYNFVTYTNIIIDSQRTYFNHYNGRQYGTLTILESYLDKVITSRPYLTNVSRTATHTLIPFLASDDTQINVIVKCYNKSTGFVRQASFPVPPTAGSTDEVQQVNVSPVCINRNSPSLIDNYIDYYTVTFDTTNIIDDSILRFNIVCESKYEIQSLYFLNKFGGFESVEFPKVSRKTLSSQKSDYKKTSYTIDSNGNVTWFNSTTFPVYNEQVTTFAVQYGEKMQLNSDILTDADYKWLKELIVSPMVYCQLNGYFFPVKITETDYEERKIINDKLTSLTLNIEFGDTFNSQYR